MRTIIPVASWDDVIVPEDGDRVSRADLVAAYQALANRDECFADLACAVYELRVLQSGGFQVSKVFDRGGGFSHSGLTITFPKSGARWLCSFNLNGYVTSSTAPCLMVASREFFGRNEQSRIDTAKRTISLSGSILQTLSSLSLTWDGPAADPFSPESKGHLVIQELAPSL